jgi:NAD(P)-dependent dehydrogenase (short-subunit alcohol dehydrogenase family)
MDMPNNVVITGASSGIGYVTALRLSQAGFRVFAGVRREVDAQALRKADARLIPIMLDVTDVASIQSSVSLVTQMVGTEGVHLVNNAGIAVTGPLEFIPLEKFRQPFEVNVFGVLSVTQAFLQLIRQGDKKGRLVNIGSMNGHITASMSSAYCSAKYALRSMTDALRLELAPFQIHVVLIEAGVILTPMMDKVGQNIAGDLATWDDSTHQYYGEAYRKLSAATKVFIPIASPPEKVAQAIHAALTQRSPHAYYRVGLDAWAAIIMGSFLPVRLRDWLIVKMYSIGG